MPQLRQDPTTKEWVIIAVERSKRPHDFIKTKDRRIKLIIFINVSLPEETAQFLRED